ncbi:hydroxyphenylacetyl-CoA thioesterase PaaI [Halorussus aquaticus]|uniref:Hydroxyphenylacetyl-CoA thioesterase PaaI n=1 Tax=Halorussus aquaticus TaxID=2953748 RepID=A0ABD5PX17_9EURY|nr:hydroxyphenylacetyl-CoA thioesterase PaaI [Halorussus aquaticus]
MTEVSDDRRETIESDPFCEKLGIELAALGPGNARTELTVTDDLLNFHGTPHGGVVYSLADAAFAAASNSECDTALAMETNISYFEAVEVGETLTADADRLHRRGRTASYRVAVTDESGDEIATFRGRVYHPDE